MAREPGHRAHRPVGLRQVDVPADPQPHARARSRRVAGRDGRCSTTSTSTGSSSRSPRSAGASAWCSRSRTRSRRCPSPRTCSPASSSPAAPAARRHATRSSRTACDAPACGTRCKNRLGTPGGALSGGQQQRLCIARALAVQPDILLMDEPCSALDPTSTRRIEETIAELREQVTIVIVTHNMQQAQRVSQHCAFFLAAENEPGYDRRAGPDRRRCSPSPTTPARSTTSAGGSDDERHGGPGALCARLVVALSFADRRPVGARPRMPTPAINGAGSTWSQIAVDQWTADVARQGLSINYQRVGFDLGPGLLLPGPGRLRRVRDPVHGRVPRRDGHRCRRTRSRSRRTARTPTCPTSPAARRSCTTST